MVACVIWLVSAVSCSQKINLQNAEQHDHRADERVEEKLDRRVQTVFAAPDADQEIHRHERHFEEQIEQETDPSK